MTRGNLNFRRELNEAHVPSFCPIICRHFDHNNGCRVFFGVNSGNFVLLPSISSIKEQTCSSFSVICKKTTKASCDPKEKFR